MKRQTKRQRSRDKQQRIAFLQPKKTIKLPSFYKPNPLNQNYQFKIQPASRSSSSVQFDMFDSKSYQQQKYQQHNRGQFDDQQKYYKIIMGDKLQNYTIKQKMGKGVFSNVVKAQNAQSQQVAIKIMRNSQITLKAGLKQQQIIKLLNKHDKNNRKNIIRLKQSFYHQQHLCLVFQLLGQNMRNHIKQNKLSIEKIQRYAASLFLGLAHMQKYKIIHSDIKPDNILYKKQNDNIVLADFGTAFYLQEAKTVKYLVSRYYRAPQIVLGYNYDHKIDVWSAACSLFQLFTNQFLFPAQSSYQLLKMQVETKGKFNLKMLKKSAFVHKYFDQNFLFRCFDQQNNPIKRSVNISVSSEMSLVNRLKIADYTDLKQKKKINEFRQFIQQCLYLNPKQRLSATQSLTHPFLANEVKKSINSNEILANIVFQ